MDVSSYLEPYGYTTDGDQWWGQASLPVVRLRVRVHTESGGHTLYLVECALTPLATEEQPFTWSTIQRLRYLRENLHALLRQGLGELGYARHFKSAPFARRLGPPGTTARLHEWCQTLATLMTAGLLGPTLVASVLRALNAPSPRAVRSAPVASKAVS
jgi:hypothetical protein